MQLPNSICAALNQISRPSRTVKDSRETLGRYLHAIGRSPDSESCIRIAEVVFDRREVVVAFKAAPEQDAAETFLLCAA